MCPSQSPSLPGWSLVRNAFNRLLRAFHVGIKDSFESLLWLCCYFCVCLPTTFQPSVSLWFTSLHLKLISSRFNGLSTMAETMHIQSRRRKIQVWNLQKLPMWSFDSQPDFEIALKKAQSWGSCTQATFTAVPWHASVCWHFTWTFQCSWNVQSSTETPKVLKSPSLTSSGVEVTISRRLQSSLTQITVSNP